MCRIAVVRAGTVNEMYAKGFYQQKCPEFEGIEEEKGRL